MQKGQDIVEENIFCRVGSYKLQDKILKLKLETDRGDCCDFEINCYQNNIIRFNYFPGNKTAEISLVEKHPETAENIMITEAPEDSEIIIKFEKLKMKIQKEPFRISIFNDRGREIWSQARNDLNVGLLPRVPMFCTSNSEGSGIKSIRDSFALHPDEKILGLGEKFTQLNKRGQNVESWNYDAYGVQSDRAYTNIPFFMSSRGYGLFFDTTARINHKIGSGQGSTDSYSLKVDDKNLDYYFIFGPDYQEILYKYCQLTGFSPSPPKWSFGIWMSRCYYETQEQVKSVAENLRCRELPCDVINLDGRAWLRHGKQTDFVWDRERYPDPGKLIQDLGEDNFKICLWENPYISETSELFKEAEKLGYLLTDNKGEVYKINWVPEDFCGLHNPPRSGIVDLTNPDAYKWFQDLHRENLQMGVCCYKTDFGEGVPEDSHSYSGLTGRHLHNYYPILYNKAVYEAIQQETESGIVWARSGWAGSQNYPIQWGGDSQASYSGLRGALRGALSAGLSGIPFTSHDIGGFYGDKPGKNLYIRWLQFGLLSSHARFHGTTCREPWEFGEEAVSNYRKYASLRYKLIPYLMTYAEESTRTGMPLMRALPFYDSNDPLCYYFETEYLLGEEILVAPVYTPDNEREIYLPRGSWVDFWTGREYSGGQVINYRAALDIIPLFIPEGSILPLGPEMQYVGEKELQKYHLYIFPGKEACFQIAETGDSFKACWQENNKLGIEIDSQAKSHQIEILGERKPDIIKINQEVLQKKHWQWTEKGIKLEI